MSKRFKMSKSHSKRDFSKHGSYAHKKNFSGQSRRNPMRGGIRL